MKKIYTTAILLFLWASLFCADVFAQKETNDRIVAQNREKLRQVLAQDSTPGASVAVVKNGKTVWAEGFGLANIETNTPATAETKFGLGSVSKSLTMVLALRLAEEGLLDLDAPIEKYLPDFPHKNQGVTIRLIGNHLSGYADSFGNDHYLSAKRYETTEQILKEFYAEKLAAKPGEKSLYGTTTFTLIATAIEKATKRDFVTAMNDYVLKPLQLKNIVPNDRRQIIPNRTAFYVKDATGKIVNGEFVDPSYKLAGAGFLSTAEDLAKFSAALIEPGFLKQKSLNELFQTGETSAGEKTQFALGFRVIKAQDGKELIVQPGGGIGITSILFLDRQNKISIAILANQTNSSANGRGILTSIAESFAN
jgi:serine beta-lactamase-like protein LACTB, mitochondrial